MKKTKNKMGREKEKRRVEKQRLSNTVFSTRLYKLSPCSDACVVWYSVIAEIAVSQREQMYVQCTYRSTLYTMLAHCIRYLS